MQTFLLVQFRSVLLAYGILFLCSCGSNTSTPGVESIYLNGGTVSDGATIIVSTQFFISTGGSRRESDPFSLVITLPIGVKYIPGTAGLAYQPRQEPNAMGRCPDGRTFMLYDFGRGAVDNTYNFEKYSSDLSLSVIVSEIAVDREAGAAASTISPPTPCLVTPEATTTFHVKSS